MRESPIQQRILLALSRGATRLFRQNVGLAWAGKSDPCRRAGMVMCYPGDVIVRQAQPLRAGLCVGSSDCIGWTTIDGIAVFTAIEVKSSTGRATDDQKNFIARVIEAGGIAGIARSEDEAAALIESYRSSGRC